MDCCFDEIVERQNTNCLKYDFARERKKPCNLLSFWIADMDFKISPAIADAICKTAAHGIYGYTEIKQPYYDVVSSWFEKNFNFPIKREWVVKTPGIMFALALAVRAFSERGDAVMIQKPVYYPFSEVIIDNGRKLINNSLVYKNGKYEIDFNDFEEKIVTNKVKVFLLCSPHNPVGRVWTKEELIRMGTICKKYGCIVVSDEIHCDFVYAGNTHTIFASLSKELADNVIVCTSPTKSFNIAGLQISNIIIPNREIKKKFKHEYAKTGYSQLNTVSLAAGQAAYEFGGEWFNQLKQYLTDNLAFVRTFLAQEMPQIKLIEPEGTYLLWLDFNNSGIPLDEIEDFVTDKAGLWLDGGTMFGHEGVGFQRINIACPRAMLKRALQQLKEAFEVINK
ncbi:cystathionine beta-lyase [Clostridia bacterium]|nr:cystathionine beta-lyase [Clostridia bacterium]GHU81836.1 cystathionine beta-lyase [Clostridia bacterium]